MSAAQALQVAVQGALGDLGCTVFDAPPVRGSFPHAVIEEPALREWSTKSWEGRQGRVAVMLHDAGERPVRLRALAAAAELRLAAMLPDLGDGWRLVTMQLTGTRLVQGPGDRWVATVGMRVRLWRDA
jgi:hypothetical protein